MEARPPLDAQCRDCARWGRVALSPSERQLLLNGLLFRAEYDPKVPASMPRDNEGRPVFVETRGKYGVSTEIDLTALGEVNPDLLYFLYCTLRNRVNELDQPATPR